MRFIVHAGQPKTGSTAIQRFLSRNRKNLARHGVFIPRYQLGGSHQWMTGLILHRLRLQRKAMAFRHGRETPTSGRLLKAIAWREFIVLWAQLKLTKQKTVLLSAEQFLGLRANNQVGKFVRLLRVLGARQIEFILFLRNPIDHGASQLLEQLKRGVADKSALPPLRPQAVIDFVDQLVNVREVAVTLLEYRGSKHGQDVRVDLLNKVVGDFNSVDFDWTVAGANRSISAEVGFVLAVYREKWFPTIDSRPRPTPLIELRERLIATEEALGGPATPSIRPQAMVTMNRLSEDYLNWLKNRHNFHFNAAPPSNLGSDSNGERLGDVGGSALVQEVFDLDQVRLRALLEVAREFEGAR